jgi:hypothetical protein
MTLSRVRVLPWISIRSKVTFWPGCTSKERSMVRALASMLVSGVTLTYA